MRWATSRRGPSPTPRGRPPSWCTTGPTCSFTPRSFGHRAGTASPKPWPAPAAGPFNDASAAPLVCPASGAIDPSVYGSGGLTWLIWKSEAGARPATIWSQPLAAGGQALTGVPTPLLQPTQIWEHGVVEAPSMLRDGSSVMLFYSGSNWDTSGYAIGYAVCASPSGPCRKPESSPILASSGSLVGPGGADVLRGRRRRPERRLPCMGRHRRRLSQQPLVVPPPRDLDRRRPGAHDVMRFRDRAEAGEQLAERLAHHAGRGAGRAGPAPGRCAGGARPSRWPSVPPSRCWWPARWVHLISPSSASARWPKAVSGCAVTRR